MSSRSLDDLLPGTKAKVESWLFDCLGEIPQPVFITCTYRSQKEQDELYGHGRDGDTRPRVTWTLHSKHTERRAVDFALRAQNPWDLKCDVDEDGIPDFMEVGILAEKHGLIWGGRWYKADYAHVQDDEIYEEVV